MSAVVVLSAKLPMKILNVPTLLKPGMMQKINVKTNLQFKILKKKIEKIVKIQNANTTNQTYLVYHFTWNSYRHFSTTACLHKLHDQLKVLNPRHNSWHPTSYFLLTVFKGRSRLLYAFTNNVTPTNFRSLHFSLLFLPDFFSMMQHSQPLFYNLATLKAFSPKKHFHPYYFTM